MSDTIITIGIVALLLVAVFAIAKGRGFRFTAQRGKNKLDVGVTKQQQQVEPAGAISNVEVARNANIDRSNVKIDVGQKTVKK